MFGRRLVVFLIVYVLGVTGSTGSAAPSSRVRPYSGIGLVVFSQSGTVLEQDLQVQMFEEPGLSRIGILNSTRLPANEWIFGLNDGAPPLIVSARKGDWLRVHYDDAGREAWINPQNKGRFQSWEQFLKRQGGRMLPGLPPHYYQLQLQPGGKLLATLTPKQAFKVLKIENEWGMILIGQTQIGWVRWCDDDGRLLVGLDRR